MFKTFLAGLILILAGVSVSFLNPDFFMRKKLAYENIILHYSGAEPENAEDVLREAYLKAENFRFFSADSEYHVYLSAGFGQFAFFAKPAKDDYLWVNPLNGKIIIAGADFGEGKARRKGSDEPRDLVSIIVKGAAMKALLDRIGFLKYVALKDWKKIGIGEYAAGEKEMFMTSEICDKDRSGMNMKHYKYMLGVELLMREDELGLDDIIETKRSFKSIEKTLKKRYCGSKPF